MVKLIELLYCCPDAKAATFVFVPNSKALTGKFKWLQALGSTSGAMLKFGNESKLR